MSNSFFEAVQSQVATLYRAARAFVMPECCFMVTLNLSGRCFEPAPGAAGPSAPARYSGSCCQPQALGKGPPVLKQVCGVVLNDHLKGKHIN